MNCLKGDQCPYAHPDSKPDGHVYKKPSRSPKGRRKGNNKKRPKGAQLMCGTVGRMMLAAATMAAISTGPVVAESLQHNAVAKQWFGASSAEYDPEKFPTTSSMTTGLAAKMSYKCSVDFGSYSVVPFQVEDGNTLWPGGGQTDTPRLYEKRWTTEQLQQEMASTVSRQQKMNDRMDGIEKSVSLDNRDRHPTASKPLRLRGSDATGECACRR